MSAAADVLYVSPHADDVAFSAAGQIARDRAAGLRVCVLTLFEADAEGTATAAAFGDAVARRAEDRTWAAGAGVATAHGGWPDAIVRHRRYRAPGRLFAPLDAVEAPLVEAIHAALQREVQRGCRRVVAPLGVGGHVDHQVAHAAARALAGVEVRFYEDVPYVLTPYQLARRLARLGCAQLTTDDGDHDGDRATDGTLARGGWRAELRAAARSWLGSPLFRAAIHPALRHLALSAMLLAEERAWRRAPPAPPLCARATLLRAPDLAEVKLEAIATYASQWPLFYPALADWRAALEGYGRALGAGGIVERVWTLAPAASAPIG